MLKLACCVVGLLIAPLSARADQFDCLCLFATAAAAQADPAIGQYWNGTNWDMSRVFPGIKVVTPAATLNGVSTGTGFWINVSWVIPNAAVAAEVTSTGPCYLILDRDVAVSGGSFVSSAAISGTNRTSLSFSPVPEGSAYPSPLGQ